MRVNFDQPLVDLDGKLIEEGAEGEKKEVTLRVVCINALFTPDEKDNPSGEKKLERYLLAQRIATGEAEVDVTELALLKQLIGKYFGVIVVGQVYPMLEGEKIVGLVPKPDDQ